MADTVLEPPILTPRKRNYEGEIIDQPSPNMTVNMISTNETTPASRHASPAPSVASSLTELSSIADPSINAQASCSGAQPAKKRKLTFIEREAEKAARKREKEEKEKQRVEEKVRREELKKQKDELKRKQAEEKEETKRLKDLEKAEQQKAKDAEKAEKQKVKDAENQEKEVKKQEREAKKQEKEAEKSRQAAEKAKKERAQMKLGAFFTNRPAPASTPPSTPDDASEIGSSRRSSIVSLNLETPVLNVKTPQKEFNSEFSRWILPFFVPEHTELAPLNRYKQPEHSFELVSESAHEIQPVKTHFHRSRRRNRKLVPVKKILEKIQSNDDVSSIQDQATDLLNHVPYKYLSFREDVRPPYQGTYTRVVSPYSSRKVSRNPFARHIPDINYDYDSEAEWEPPGDDDEDLNDEDEMSEADDIDEEMEDFLDDADDLGRRKGPMCDMEPISSGLCWVDQENGQIDKDLKQYRMDVLHDSTTFPIDPFSSRHWVDELKPKPSPMKAKTEPTTAAMQPPRLPLASLTPNTITSLLKPDSCEKDLNASKAKGRPINPDKAVKMIDAEFLPSFKQAVDGSDLTKAGLIEILKKKFPKCSKDAIKDTLGAVAVRVGKKEAEKKWQLVT